MSGGRSFVPGRAHPRFLLSAASLVLALLAVLASPGSAFAQGGWQIQNLPALPAGSTYNVAAISPVDANDLWVAGNIMPGYDTFIGRSADGGATWTVVHRSALGIVYRLNKILGAGLNCGAGGTRCSVVMPGAMRLGLEAEPSAGYTFDGWTGDCSGSSPAYLISLNGPRTCGAIFVR